MSNGFIVNITNQTNAVIELQLFSGLLPAGVAIQTLDGSYDFDGLKLAAEINPLIGNVLTTNSEEGVRITIVTKDRQDYILLNERHEGSEIIIDGKDNFIQVNCPANSNFYIRLNTIPTSEI